MIKKAFIIENIEEYGKLMAFCIDNDISVWRTYWHNDNTDIYYSINWIEKRCYYARKQWWIKNEYKIFKPIFYKDEWGKIKIKKGE